MDQGATALLEAAPQLSQQPTAALVAWSALLRLSGADVDAWLDRQLASSPALETPAPRTCPQCAGTVWHAGAHTCSAALSRSGDAPAGERADEQADEVRDAVASAARLGPHGRRVAEHLLADLDHRGRLDRPLDAIAAGLRVPLTTVTAVLADLRASLGAGLGARDLRESLLLQLAARPGAPGLCAPLVAGHLAQVAAGRFAAAAEALGVPTDDVRAAAAWIAAELDPGRPVGGATDHRPAPAPPDLVVREEQGRLVVRCADSRWQAARVAAAYRRADDPDDRAAVAAALEVLSRLAGRAATVTRVAQAAVERQRDMVLGVGPVVPLTRAELAQELGLHESTVSRAVAEKTLLLPGGGRRPLVDLFGLPGGLAREHLRQLLESAASSCSDAELARLLTADGHPTARRTVAKYRAQLGVPSRRS